MEKTRVKYIDVLKFFGILFIYVGHFTKSAGLLYNFVFTFHVPLFFFLSGCTENFNSEKNVWKRIKKKALNILLPFYVFAFFAIVVRCIHQGGDLKTVARYIKEVAAGCIRNVFFSSSLWFLTCLFVMSLLFEILRLVKSKTIMTLLSVLPVLFAEGIIKVTPTRIFNINAAFYYLLYFTLGYVMFGKIDAVLNSKTKKQKIIKYSTGAIALAYTALLFFKHNIYTFLNIVPIVKHYLTALTAIWAFLILAYMCRNISLLSNLGQSTLYFCGSEYIVKTIAGSVISMFVPFAVSNGIQAISYSFILLLLSQRFMVPIEKNILTYIKCFLTEKLCLFIGQDMVRNHRKSP